MSERLPKAIWLLWLQGWDQAPEIVRACAATWIFHNPDWTIHFVSQDNLSDYLHSSPLLQLVQDKALPPEAYSDVIRIELLHRFGGVWADSTVYCLQPLDDWIHASTASGFFAFDRPGPDRMISSWFLAAKPGSYIVQRWREEVYAYWRARDERKDYSWVHYLFESAYRSDAVFSTLWDQTRKISAKGPHALLPYHRNLLKRADEGDAALLEQTDIPVLKLTHKLQHGTDRPDTTYQLLCDRADQLSSRLDRECAPPKASHGVRRAKSIEHCSRILLSWFGSLRGHGTIGDLLSVQVVSHWLMARGYRFVHASATSDWGVSGLNHQIKDIRPDDIDVLIFACGPIIAGHPIVESVIRAFGGCRKVGVGVSLLPLGNARYLQPFDVVYARESDVDAFPDIAIAAPLVVRARHERSRALRVGVVLRGMQDEYGRDNCLDVETGALVERIVGELGRRYEVEIIPIENRIAKSALMPDEIDVVYAGCDLVLTSRFHGAVMALRNAVPFIALDQIRGGAKVSRLLSATGWPHVYRVDTVSPETVLNAALDIAAQDRALELQTILTKLRADAYAALDRLSDALTSSGFEARYRDSSSQN